MIEDFPIKPRYQKRFAVNIVSAFSYFQTISFDLSKIGFRTPL